MKFEFKKRQGSPQREFNIRTSANEFIEDKRLQKRSDKTLKTYYQALNHFIKFVENREMKGDEEECVRDYIRWLSFEKTKWDDHPTNHSKQIGVSARTANNTIRVLRIFYNWCKSRKYIFSNPAENAPYQTEEEEGFEILTTDEVKAILAVPNRRTYTGNRDYIMMMLMIDTGMRVGEMSALVRGDVDLVYRQITIRAEISKGRRMRTVPISSTMANLLRELFDYIGISDEDADEYIFLTQFGERYFGDTFGKMIRKYAKKASREIKGRPSPHTFRHYFAINYLKNGGTPFSLMTILGHTDMTMTQKYVRYAESDLIEIHEKASPAESLLNGNEKKRGAVRFK